MTSIILLHGARQTPNVWRAVSDSFPPPWGVVAPQLHGREDLNAMNHAIVRDLEQIYVQLPLVVVAHGAGVIPAAEFVARNANTGDIAGLLISDPQISVTAGDVRTAKLKAAVRGRSRKSGGKRAAITDATFQQRVDYLASLAGQSAHEQLRAVANAGVPICILAGEKNHAGVRDAHALTELLPDAQYYMIAQAERDWNAYAPVNFAANIAEFVEKIALQAG